MNTCVHGFESGHRVSETLLCGGPPINWPISHGPRVLARITEDSTARYRMRCEECPHLYAEDGYAELHLVAKWAREHAINTGHAVLVEAL